MEYIDVTNNATLLVRTFDGGECTVWSTFDEMAPGKLRKYRPWRDLDKGHVGDIYFAKFFPSGKVVLSGGADTTLRIWDVMDDEFDGSPVTMLKGHQQAVFEADFVERGRNIVSCSRDGTAKLFDVSTQAIIASFSPDAGPILSVRVGSHPGASTAASADPRESGTDGKVVVLAADNGGAYMFDIRARSQVAHLKNSSAADPACSMNRLCFVAGHLAAGDSVGRIGLWDMRNLSLPTAQIQRNTAAITSLTPYGANQILVSQGDGACFAWDISAGKSVAELCATDYDPIYAVGVAPSVKQVFTAGRDGVMRSFQL
jgi:proteasomal ATPase-associated factor 1